MKIELEAKLLDVIKTLKWMRKCGFIKPMITKEYKTSRWDWK